MQYKSGWGDTVKNMVKESSSIVANLISNYPSAVRQDDAWQREDERRETESKAVSDVRSLAKHLGINLDERKHETVEEITERFDISANDYINSLPIELRAKASEELYSAAKAYGLKRTQETAGGISAAAQMRGESSRLDPQPEPVQQVPSLESQQSRFGQSSPLGAMGGRMLSVPQIDAGAMNMGTPIGASAPSVGGIGQQLNIPLGAQQPQSPQQSNRFAMRAPDYTAGFAEEMRRMADNVESGRMTYKDGMARQNDLIEGSRKARIQQEEFEYKTNEQRRRTLADQVVAAYDKFHIIDRETRQGIEHLDPEAVYNNPERFMIGSPLTSEMSEMDKLKMDKMRADIDWTTRRESGRGKKGSGSGNSDDDPRLWIQTLGAEGGRIAKEIGDAESPEEVAALGIRAGLNERALGTLTLAANLSFGSDSGMSVADALPLASKYKSTVTISGNMDSLVTNGKIDLSNPQIMQSALTNMRDPNISPAQFRNETVDTFLAVALGGSEEYVPPLTGDNLWPLYLRALEINKPKEYNELMKTERRRTKIRPAINNTPKTIYIDGQEIQVGGASAASNTTIETPVAGGKQRQIPVSFNGRQQMENLTSYRGKAALVEALSTAGLLWFDENGALQIME